MQAVPRWPYAVPLPAIDRVVAMDADGIVTERTIRADEPLLAGHFPGCPIYPGVFVLEAVHQSVLIYADHQLQQSHPPELVQVRSVRLASPLVPGDTFQVDCRCDIGEDGLLHVQATCRRTEQATGQMKLGYRMGGDA